MVTTNTATTPRSQNHNHRVHQHDAADAAAPRRSSPADEVASHTVKPGESLWSIARAHGSTVQELRELNPELKGDLIRPGQKLEVVNVEPVAKKPVDRDVQRSARGRASANDAAIRNRLDSRYTADAPSFAEIKNGEVMRRGMGGENVKELQTKLNKLGADLEVDGKFGPMTQAAVREFQGDHKLPETGRVDKDTVAALEQAKPKPRKREVDGPIDSSLGPTKNATAYVNGVPRTIRVVEVEGKLVEVRQAQRYLEMKKAAAKDGVDLQLVSGFRTMAEQRRLYDGWINKRPGFNLAARPGFSNHQSGTALDLNTQGTSDSVGTGKVYNWLAKNGARFDFARIPSEHWHWEFKR